MRPMCLTLRIAILNCCIPFLTMPAPGETWPQVRITNIRRAFHNGEHNAFTDMVRFRDRFYLTFRSCPNGHMVHPSASIIILSSTDAQQWEQVHRFSVAKRDTRDPHFLVFKDKLFVYTGTWYCGDGSPKPEDYELNLHLGYAAWSEKGPKTSLCWLVNDQLREFAELPSGGDNSYPGFVEISPSRAIVSWYSSHEKDADGRVMTAIYLADLETVE